MPRPPRPRRRPARVDRDPLALREVGDLLAASSSDAGEQLLPRRRPGRAGRRASIASAGTASATANGPTAVRRSAVRCPPTPRRGAEVAGERADVGARRAVDDDVEVDEPAPSRRSASTSKREIVTARGGERDLLAGAGALVRALAVDLDGAEGRGHLRDLAA